MHRYHTYWVRKEQATATAVPVSSIWYWYQVCVHQTPVPSDVNRAKKGAIYLVVDTINRLFVFGSQLYV